MHVVSQLWVFFLEVPAIECALYKKVETGNMGQQLNLTEIQRQSGAFLWLLRETSTQTAESVCIQTAGNKKGKGQ